MTAYAFSFAALKGGEIKLADSAAAAEVFDTLKSIQGLNEKLTALGVKTKDIVEEQVAAAEFVLEGLYAHRRISRNEETGYVAEQRRRDPPDEQKAKIKRQYQ